MYFPSNGSGKPYCRIDGRSGTFALSTADGDPEVVEMRGQLLDLDLRQARQGWLAFSPAGADFVALETRDAWRPAFSSAGVRSWRSKATCRT